MRTEAVPPGALASYRRTAKAAFLSKADVEVSNEVLESLQQNKALFAAQAAEPLAGEITRVLGQAPGTVEFLPGQGTFHAVFRFEIGPDAFYARTSLPAIAEPALDFIVDAWASENLPDQGIPTPRVRHVDLSRSRLPFDVEILEAAVGEPLPPGPADAGVAALGSVAAKVHGLACSGFGPLDPVTLEREHTPSGYHESWCGYVMLRLDPHLDACREAGALTAEQALKARAAFRQAESLLSETPSALLHGDLGNHNVFVRAGRVSALIDWEDSLAGDPVFDISSWGTFVGNHERRDAFLEGYREFADLPADFELRYWLYFLRIMLAKTVHRQRFGYARRDRIAPAARLRPALDAVCAHLDGGS